MSFIDRILPKDKNVRRVILMLCDVFVLAISSFLGVLIRFDLNPASVPKEYIAPPIRYFAIYVICTIFIFYIYHLYDYMWSIASIHEASVIFVACVTATLTQVAGMTFMKLHMHRSYYIICFAVLLGLEILLRYSYRIFANIKRSLPSNYGAVSANLPKIMIVGAGSSGLSILKELNYSSHIDGRVVCFIDDNPNKKGKILNNIRIEGGRELIPEMVEKYKVDKIYIAMPSAKPSERRKIIEICQQTDCEIKILPGVYQLLNGEVSVSRMRKVQIEDLLGRDPIQINNEELFSMINEQVVLVTGGGGSIGSELCRQIAVHHPKQLVVFDIYENNIYDLQQELKLSVPDLNVEYLIGSVRNAHRVNSVFDKYKPNLVFHAAAHKHVPLMEDSPNEAIKNNVLGTYNVAIAADRYSVDTMLLISTDKAVNPTNIMGASKRLCEMVVQMMSRHSDTKFVAVRFGNVLGSNGSVVPLFRKQIEAGGPVTVTHPDIIRYFMTIPEAVSLILQAAYYAEGGEIFVLNMGEPIKILDLAKNMIRLSGYKPNEDIKIEFTGLRPGEKLYEELLMSEEGLQKTENSLIFVGEPIQFDDEQFVARIQKLGEAAYEDTEEIRGLVQSLVPTYHPKADETADCE